MGKRPEFYYDPKTGYYRKRIKLQSGRWKDVRGKTREETREKVRRLLEAQALGILLDDKTTVAELAAEWYRNRKDKWSYSRRGDYVNAINVHICPVMGAMPVRAVKAEHCQRVLAQMGGLSHSLQSKVVTTLKQIFACAEENGLILRSPCAALKAGGERAKEKIPLTPAQCAALEGAARDNSRAYLFVLLGLYAGLRREEICGLRWSDVDLTAQPPRLTVNQAARFEGSRAVFPAPLKTQAARRTIPLPPLLAGALRQARGASDSLFVVPAAGGGVATPQTVRNLWRYLDRRMGVSLPDAAGDSFNEPCSIHEQAPPPVRATPHLLRHTYITRLCESGMDIKKIQYLAGHSDIKVTLGIYCHVVHNRPEELIGPIQRAFGGAVSPAS